MRFTSHCPGKTRIYSAWHDGFGVYFSIGPNQFHILLFKLMLRTSHMHPYSVLKPL